MNFFKKPEPIINDKDILELKEIQRQAYMESAREIMKEKGKALAKNDLQVKKSI